MNGKNSQKCECKDNYILQLDNTNKEQRDFYYTKIPQIFNVRFPFFFFYLCERLVSKKYPTFMIIMATYKVLISVAE